MKRTNRILMLTGILAVSCIATFAISKYEEKQEAIQNSDAIILELPADTVDAISWNVNNTEFSFHKEEDNWIYDEDEAFPVSEAALSDILSLFEGFGASFIIEDAQDLEQYGLDDPQGIISLTAQDTTYELRLGDFSKMDELRYADIGDGNVYLVNKDPIDYLKTDLSDMILHDDIPNLKTATRITFEGLENYTITYSDPEENTASYSENDVYFTQKDGKTLPLDTDTIKDYLSTLTSLRLQNYVTYNATSQELESYGLYDPALSVTISYTYEDEDGNSISDTCVVHISENPLEAEEAAKKAEEATQDEEAVIPSVTKYFRIGNSQIVYEITNTTYTNLTSVSYDDLRHKEIFWADFDLVTQMDIELENETHTLTMQKNEDEENVWYYEETQIDTANLQTALEALTADSFTDEAAEQKEEIDITLHLDHESFSEVHLQLYRYDGSYCLAVVDGESIALVERSLVVDLIETVQTIILDQKA